VLDTDKMGKKEKNKKKGKGAEKTIEKTQKKLKSKVKKETGEDDIENIVKDIEAEEQKRKEVKENKVDPPSHRSNLSLLAHPDHPELVLFGGEFHNGNKTTMFNDLLIFNTKRKDWTEIKSPAGPAPRSSHQAVMTAQSGGQLWIFGGEFASASESQFHHYRDLWVFHFASKRWEKVLPAAVPGKAAVPPPTSRSGHRMVLLKRHLVLFGGFHDNLDKCTYFNDVHVFSLEERCWRKVETSGTAPGPRSGCCMATLQDGRILVYGGFCKEKAKKGKKEDEGKTMADMYLLVPDKNDETLSKWRWLTVKQIGAKPCARSGISAVAVTGTNRVGFFGGVQDNEDAESEDSDDEDGTAGNFFNDLLSVNIENERATWTKIELTGKKDGAVKKRKKDGSPNDGDKEEQEVEEDCDEPAKEEVDKVVTKVVEDGAFTITSTVGLETKNSSENKFEEAKLETKLSQMNLLKGPSPRFGAQMAIKQGILYLFGGLVEDSNDRQFTHKDLYALDFHKLDEWEVIIESDLKTMEWEDSEDSEGENSEDESADDDDKDEMDMSQ